MEQTLNMRKLQFYKLDSNFLFIYILLKKEKGFYNKDYIESKRKEIAEKPFEG